MIENVFSLIVVVSRTTAERGGQERCHALGYVTTGPKESVAHRLEVHNSPAQTAQLTTQVCVDQEIFAIPTIHSPSEIILCELYRAYSLVNIFRLNVPHSTT